jgi:hypothetical protein
VPAEARFAWLQKPGAWFWLALAAGGVLRVYLVVFTDGSFDVLVKQHHARSLEAFGLIEYYRRGPVFNHPPLAGRFFEAASALAELTGTPFRVWLRAPFAALDAAAAWALFALFRASPWRHAVVAGYWLNPLAWIFSAYHGNTDSFVACAAAFALLAAARDRALLAGVALGLGVAIKLPAALAAPALCFWLAGWRRRTAFAGGLTLTALGLYLPELAREPLLLASRIAGYPGSGAETVHGVPIWGVWTALGLARVPGLGGVAELATAHNTLLCLVPIVAVAWLRRERRDPHELGASLFASFMLLYGLSAQWAFQYLAWSAPFWCFRGARYAVAGSLLLGGYIYGVYAFYCGNPWLLGVWDHVGHPVWPTWLAWLRGAAVAFCFGSAVWIVGEAASSALRSRRTGDA